MASIENEPLKVSSKKFEGSPFRLILAALCASVGPLTFGYTIGFSSPAIPKIETSSNLLPTKELSAWFGSLMTIGAIFGGPCAGYLIEKIGRRRTIMATSLPFVAGWFSIGYAGNTNHLLFGRLLCGFASGMVSVSSPVYIAEVSTKSLRGLLGSFVQLSITIGILLAYVLGAYQKWTTFALLGVIPSALTFFAMMFVPETPRWLLMKNQKADALRALMMLRGPHVDVEDECRDIEEGFDSQEAFSLSELKKPEYFRPLMVSVAIMFFQQFSGINAVMFYAESIFKSAGFEESSKPSIIVGAVQVIATFIACLLMDKAGRRNLLMLAGIIMMLTCMSFGWYYYILKSGKPTGLVTHLPMLSLVIYIAGFSLGWGPIPMLVMSEIFPAKARGTASGIAIFAVWIFAFIITKEFVVMQEMIGQAQTFWFFGLCCFCGVVFVYKNLPETKGKSLEDIELYFLGRSVHV